MATTQLPSDFKEFLRLLNASAVEYLVIGGYAVGYHGYPRATIDLDLWIATSPENTERAVAVIREFGFGEENLTAEVFSRDSQIIRMGVPPIRIEIMTTISGVRFEECYAQRIIDTLDGVEANLISLADLKRNKQASGRHKDLNDLEHL